MLSFAQSALLVQCLEKRSTSQLLELDECSVERPRRLLRTEGVHLMPPKAGFTPPQHDPQIDAHRFVPVDRTDPRYNQEGPCQTHIVVDENLKEYQPDKQSWGGNRAARWIECRQCGLRLGYWPKVGSPAMYMKLHPPTAARSALLNLETNYAKWRPTAKLVKSLIQTAVEEEKRGAEPKVVRATRAPRSASVPKSTKVETSESSESWIALSPRGNTSSLPGSSGSLRLSEAEVELKAAKERELALQERLSTLERLMGICAPTPPEQEVFPHPVQSETIPVPEEDTSGSR